MASAHATLERPAIREIRGRAHAAAARSFGAGAARATAPRGRSRLRAGQLDRASGRTLSAGRGVGIDSSPNMLGTARAAAAAIAHSSKPTSRPGRRRRDDRCFVRQRGVPMGAGSSRGAAPADGKPCRRAACSRCRCPTTRASPRIVSARSRRELAVAAKARSPPPSGRGDLPSPEFYYDLLKPICAHVDIWQIVYNHAHGRRAGHRRMVQRLVAAAAPRRARRRRPGEISLQPIRDKIARAYRPRFDGKVLLRFPRFFIVATQHGCLYPAFANRPPEHQLDVGVEIGFQIERVAVVEHHHPDVDERDRADDDERHSVTAERLMSPRLMPRWMVRCNCSMQGR